MIKHWQYSALNVHGHEVSGILALSKPQAKAYFAQHHLELVYLKPDWQAMLAKSFKAKSLSRKTMSEFFEDLSNMQETGMGVSHMLMAISESSTHHSMPFIVNTIQQAISDGKSLADAFAATGIFPWIVISTLRSGEQSGELEAGYKILSKYFQRQEEISTRLKDALIYPAIVFCLLIFVMLFVGLYVIPKLKVLLPETTNTHGVTGMVIALSLFIQNNFLWAGLAFLMGISVLIFILKFNKQLFERLMYHLPVVGQIKKETDLSFYLLNLSILLRNGLPVIQCINDLNALNTSIVSRHFYATKEYLFGGMPLWEALKADSFFSPAIVFTIRRGEEMARLPEYCFNLSDYFNKRVKKFLDQGILLIQPALLLGAAFFLIIIAFAFLIPVYGSLTQIAGG